MSEDRASLEESPDRASLEAVQALALSLAQEGGERLLQHSQRPLTVEYKGKGNTSPVTEVDKEIEKFLHQEILKRFPHHGILGEEGPAVEGGGSPFLWVLDPLDGTANYIRGLPIYGLSIGVLFHGRPVAGAISLPQAGQAAMKVFSAHQGAGAYASRKKLSVAPLPEQRDALFAGLPVYWNRVFRWEKGLRPRIGEIRSTGSIAYEMALTAQGVFHYSLFYAPHIWDVAGGVTLVKEAGGEVLTWEGRRQGWQPLHRFAPNSREKELKEWRHPLLAGHPDVVNLVATHLKPGPVLWRRLLWRIRRALAEKAGPKGVKGS